MPESQPGGFQRTDLLCLGALLALYVLSFLPHVFIADSVPQVCLPLAMSYGAHPLLFEGWTLTGDIRSVAAAPAAAYLIYPPGLYGFIRLCQTALGPSIRDVFAALFALQALVPVLAYFLFKRVLTRPAAFLTSLFLTLHGVMIYTIPDFLNQILLLGSMLLLLRAYEEDRPVLRLCLAGLVCGLNVAVKHNIGLAWAAAAGGFILLKNLRVPRCPEEASPAAPLLLGAVFVAYGATVSRLFGTPDNLVLFSLPYAAFWGALGGAFLRRRLALGVREVAVQWTAFGLPFAAATLAAFLAAGLRIGYPKYFAFLFTSSLEHASSWDKGVALRGLLYYGKDGALDLLHPHKLKMLLLWFSPFLVNFGLTAWLLRAGRLEASLPVLPLVSLSIVGVYIFFPLESYFNLSTKLAIPLFSLAAASRGALLRGEGRAPRAVLLTLALLVLPSLKDSLQGSFHALARARSMADPFPDRLHILLPRQQSEELARGADLIRRTVGDSRFYILGSNSGDTAMYYRLLDYPFRNYYADLRDGFLTPEASQALIQDLEGCAYVVVEKQDYDAYVRDRAGRNQTLRAALAHVSERFETVTAYQTPRPGEFPGLYDFYIMKRRLPNGEDP